MQILHAVPPAPTFGDYCFRLWLALLNKEDVIIFDKARVRAMYKEAYPKAKV